MPTTDPTRPDETPAASQSDPAAGHQMDSRMMWMMMIGCCLAIPFALIIGGASLGGLAGASPWLIGIGVVLAVALVVVRRRPDGGGDHCDVPPHGRG